MNNIYIHIMHVYYAYIHICGISTELQSANSVQCANINYFSHLPVRYSGMDSNAHITISRAASINTIMCPRVNMFEIYI